jgi:hypothetical protein
MLRQYLMSIARLLSENGETARAVTIESAVNGTDEQYGAFLTSNELWGGAGSVADSALTDGCAEVRRKVEDLLIQLGREQIRIGKVNPRTAAWVEAFTQWRGLSPLR